MTVKKYLNESIRVGDRDLTVEVGRVAKQADGSCVVRYGDTMVLCAAVGALTPREGIDFFPLTVEYREGKPYRVDTVVVSSQHTEDILDRTGKKITCLALIDNRTGAGDTSACLQHRLAPSLHSGPARTTGAPRASTMAMLPSGDSGGRRSRRP